MGRILLFPRSPPRRRRTARSRTETSLVEGLKTIRVHKRFVVLGVVAVPQPQLLVKSFDQLLHHLGKHHQTILVIPQGQLNARKDTND